MDRSRRPAAGGARERGGAPRGAPSASALEAVLAEDTAAVIRGSSLDLFAFRARARALDEAAKVLASLQGPAARGGAPGERRSRDRGSSASCSSGSSPRSARGPTTRRSSATRRASWCAGWWRRGRQPARPAGRARTATSGCRSTCSPCATRSHEPGAARGPAGSRRGPLPARAAPRAAAVPARPGGPRAGAHRHRRGHARRAEGSSTRSGWRARRRFTWASTLDPAALPARLAAARGAPARRRGARRSSRRAADARAVLSRQGARAAPRRAAVPAGRRHARALDGAAAGARCRVRRAAGTAGRVDGGPAALRGPARRRAALAAPRSSARRRRATGSCLNPPDEDVESLRAPGPGAPRRWRSARRSPPRSSTRTRRRGARSRRGAPSATRRSTSSRGSSGRADVQRAPAAASFSSTIMSATL